MMASTDPIEDLRNLADDPFADLRDAGPLLSVALEELSKEADDLADSMADVRALGVSRVEALAVAIGHVRAATSALGDRMPSRQAPVTEGPPVEPWEWRWPNELTVGSQVRFPTADGFGPWATITSRHVQLTAGQDVTVLCLDGTRLAWIGHDEMTQVRLTDPDEIALWFEERRERMVSP